MNSELEERTPYCERCEQLVPEAFPFRFVEEGEEREVLCFCTECVKALDGPDLEGLFEFPEQEKVKSSGLRRIST